MLKKSIKILKYLISFIILFFLISNNTLNLQSMLHANIAYPILIIAFSLNFIEFIISTIRFNILLEVQNIIIPFKKILLWTLQGRFLDSFLPSSFGGDGIKVYNLNYYLNNTYNYKYLHRSNLLFATVLALGDKAFALSALFFLSSISFIFLFISTSSTYVQNYYTCIFISLSLSLTFIFSLCISLNKDILKNPFIAKLIHIKYLGSLMCTSLEIMQNFICKIKKLFSIIVLSAINQIIACLSLLILVIGTNNGILIEFNNFILLFMSLVPLFYFLNFFGVFGGFGIGTLGIGYCLEELLFINNAYELVFLSQSINLFSRLVCIFSYINYKKNIKY